MKAILVIDEMPKSCDACPLTYIDYGDDAYYGASTTRCVIDKDTIPIHGKWDECPLKPLPKKLYVEANQIEDVMHTEMNIDKLTAKIILDTDKLVALGWNACLDEIMGETE